MEPEVSVIVALQFLYTAVHAIKNIFVSFSVLYFVYLFLGLPSFLEESINQKKKAKKRGGGRKRLNSMNCHTQKMHNLEDSPIVPEFEIFVFNSSCNLSFWPHSLFFSFSIYFLASNPSLNMPLKEQKAEEEAEKRKLHELPYTENAKSGGQSNSTRI